MRIPIHQVDAFTDTLFHGNPAAICPLEAWLPDATMQRIAAENNLSETAFFVAEDDPVHALCFRLRWFTPKLEVDLCGHATLATAHVIFATHPDHDTIAFETRSGRLTVRRDGTRLEMDFPATPALPCEAPDGLLDALGGEPLEVLGGPQFVVIYENEAAIRALRPDMEPLMELERHGVICTAIGDDLEVDFVSRYFVPQSGVPEDPVTGSAHCTLTPLWAARLGKETLHARQVSARGGDLFCTLAGDRVRIGGSCVPYLQGTIEIADGGA